MNKKGLSEVVTNIILILLSLVAIGAIWIVVSNLIVGSSGSIAIEQLSIDIDFEKASIDGNDLILTIKRNPGSGNLSGIKFIISDGSNSEEFIEKTSLNELEIRTFTETLVSLSPANVKTASVAPIYISSSGEETLAGITDTISIGSFSEPGGQEPECLSSNDCLSGQECVAGTCQQQSSICSPACTGLDTCINEVCVPPACVSEDNAIACGLSACGFEINNCGQIIDCSAVNGGCSLEDACVNGVCVPPSCTPEDTAVTCSSWQCGLKANNCGQIIDCSVISGGCSPEETCSNGVCVPPSCTPEDTAVTCSSWQCGLKANNCGEFVDCTPISGGCSSRETCNIGQGTCSPITPVSGTVNSVWPSGIAKYFDSYDLPNQTGDNYAGYWAEFIPPSLESECLQISHYDIPVGLQTTVQVKLIATQTSVAPGDNVNIWATSAACLNL